MGLSIAKRYEILSWYYGGNIQGVPKKTQLSGILAITPLWKGLELKVAGVSKTSGNSLCDRHKIFQFDLLEDEKIGSKDGNPT